MITIDRTFKNETSDIKTASCADDGGKTSITACDTTPLKWSAPPSTSADTVYLNWRDMVIDTEHLKEQLALSKEEIKCLKYELDTEKAKTDRLKDYYEALIKGYRTKFSEMREKLKAETQKVEDMVCAISNITKVLADK